MNKLETQHNCSVITITLNNSSGLDETLSSLAKLNCKPYEVIIIDGLSQDFTVEVVTRYRHLLNIIFISELDFGIYNAMNKGKKIAKGELLHYLNAGDCVWGEPYVNLNQSTILNVKLLDEFGAYLGEDQIKLLGHSYCHQGVIFPRDHVEYDERFKLASDYLLLCITFPEGLYNLKKTNFGGVEYKLGGISTLKSGLGLREIICVSFRHLNLYKSILISITLICKSIIPRKLRRLYINKSSLY